MVVTFPPVSLADETGLLAIGGDLHAETLETAYRSGIFPWPLEGEPMLWFAPPRRAIIDFAAFHIPKRLQRYLKTAGFAFRVDADFAGVITACASCKNRKGQHGTWITEEMILAYIHFHKCGFAHSFEAYDEHGNLVGGLYGVLINKYFAAESMFHKQSHASKFVLIETVRYLQKLELTWMDVQIISPLLRNFGAEEISRPIFMDRLNEALQ